ncbi:hypothetical protein [Micromonospora phaseoli]|uniref:hypothetical protein n=1 Tax=Micromonospora phaseoli TaxID=1144548 RepID=UPI000B803080|nr:hypothetical protein [Micromonospora phaseoli]GIJ79039.1 hypothetical protein Xph01_34710 [Micromonospora phaseoli]
MDRRHDPLQTTLTWKAGTDPEFTAKMRGIIDLYDHPAVDRPLNPRSSTTRVADPHEAAHWH